MVDEIRRGQMDLNSIQSTILIIMMKIIVTDNQKHLYINIHSRFKF